MRSKSSRPVLEAGEREQSRSPSHHLLRIRHGPDPAMALVLRLELFHHQVLTLLGPPYEEFYKSTN
jgi:hypothetical protein